MTLASYWELKFYSFILALVIAAMFLIFMVGGALLENYYLQRRLDKLNNKKPEMKGRNGRDYYGR